MKAGFARLSGTIKRIASFITNHANAVIALFTVVLAFASIQQACIYRAQLQEMRIGQRPWLKVSYTALQVKPNEQVCTSIKITNTGKTPAKYIEGVATIKENKMGDSIDFALPAIPANGPVVIMPKGAFIRVNVGAMFPDDPIPANVCMTEVTENGGIPTIFTQEMQDRFNRGETYFASDGEVHYHDSANREHWSRFCYVYVASGKAVNTDISHSCGAFNSIDEDEN